MTKGHTYSGPSGYGHLVLVVGPSGVGKDTLMDAARDRLADDRQFCFPRRCITRPAGSVGETHIPVRPEDFGQMARQGAFLLSWMAHDLGYGIPRHVLNEVEAGKTVIVNVSRSVIADACALVGKDNVRVISIRASSDALRKRLEARGREDALDIERRLARASAYQIDGDHVVHVDNDADLETGIARFIAALEIPQSIANRA
ncbi:phosphonate metabolism protein/1,5-bisphosphokinase (PRPP-forming) PhnN [Thalassospira sp. HF15]|uniref:phosphonate metabolism protein/1,5-bisphosphokinase (PRPP-forming) PhnN n=1 Tax=Thalassospira sp. HF15 TaxID=2722755 RepID=UPI0014309011|nr:phosphonate metabolism protein/1,5-bisphosphokinase (PRPP-forming) PhnN [Thalassospira sp. HF15]NIY76732.1 phosphonate metabolism protein/1,5-bisphosphokinase (PRPP-forming) PhnN [Thalassospira sp. HF15]